MLCVGGVGVSGAGLTVFQLLIRRGGEEAGPWPGLDWAAGLLGSCHTAEPQRLLPASSHGDTNITTTVITVLTTLTLACWAVIRTPECHLGHTTASHVRSLQ